MRHESIKYKQVSVLEEINLGAQKILLPVNVKIERKLYVDMQKVL
jgi:hypothetical protein